jgi:hypothetical protein
VKAQQKTGEGSTPAGTAAPSAAQNPQARYGNEFLQQQLDKKQGGAVGGELMMRSMRETRNPAEIAQGKVGHTWVAFRGEDGSFGSWGFWPDGGFDPNRPHQSVPGIVRTPDPHDGEQQAVRRYKVSAEQVEEARAYASQNESRGYNLLTYNCTDFAAGMVESTGNAAPETADFGVDSPNEAMVGISVANASDGLDQLGRPIE